MINHGARMNYSEGNARRSGLKLAVLLWAGWVAAVASPAQTYVTPMMGGGQTAADMVHIDLYYDEVANQFHAHVDNSFGTPQLRALEPGLSFDPQAAYGVLNGQAYNAQYGWNAGGFFTIPPGAAIWIEQTKASPELGVYQDWGRLGTYTPIFGTGGSPRMWQWSGVMIHNTYAVRNPARARYFADYHIFFGDATTGSRAGYESLGDTTVHLEWTAVPVEDPLTFEFGALGETNGAPLAFLNASLFETNGGFVANLRQTNAGPWASQFECAIPMLAVPATLANGGPTTNHAALGSVLELQLVSVMGPPGGRLSYWEAGEAAPRFVVPAGETAGTNRFALSESQGIPGADPYGCISGRHYTVNKPGLYCLGFRVVDSSTNGPGGGPIHAPSETYRVFLQGGFTINSLAIRGNEITACFGGDSEKTFYLERSTAAGATGTWVGVAGPLTGTNCLQTLTDTTATNSQGLYRLRAEQK